MASGLATLLFLVATLVATQISRRQGNAARLAVQAHAIAGEAWAESHHAEAGLLAAELADALPGVLEQLRGT